MSVGVVSVSAQSNPLQKTVYYTGTDLLRRGMALCYDQDAVVGKGQTNRGQAVEKPATANLNVFAGFVAPESDNTQGPGFVRVIVPGGHNHDFVDAWVDSDLSATALVALLYIHDASYAVDATAAAGVEVARMGVQFNGAVTPGPTQVWLENRIA